MYVHKLYAHSWEPNPFTIERAHTLHTRKKQTRILDLISFVHKTIAVIIIAQKHMDYNDCDDIQVII